jgi:hypothetical protein
MRDTKGFVLVTRLLTFHLNLVHLWQLRLTRYVSMSRTSGLVYDFREKRNPGPSASGPSGNDDLDASEIFATQVEDNDEAIDEAAGEDDLEIIDDQVGFLTHHKATMLTISTPLDFCPGKSPDVAYTFYT